MTTQAQLSESVQKEFRTYKAELSDPEIPDRMEVLAANNDADAIKEAQELCEEGEGIVLLELHELDDNYDIIRNVDLSPQMTVAATQKSPNTSQDVTTANETASKVATSTQDSLPPPKKQKRGTDR